MTAIQIIKALLNAKGRFVKAGWKSNPTPSKRFKDVHLEKRTVAIVRSGVGYKNLKVIRDAIEAGERGPVQPLPYGKWVRYPYILVHEGVKYIRMTRSTEHVKFRVTKYYVDGKEVRLRTFVRYLTPSSAAQHLSSEFPIVFNVKMKNIIDIIDK